MTYRNKEKEKEKTKDKDRKKKWECKHVPEMKGKRRKRQTEVKSKRWKNNERGEEFIPRELIYW